MQYIMDILSLAFVGIAVYAIVQCVRLLKSDCDLSLQWAEIFGHSTGSLKGAVVWIVGASSGIGEALAHRLAQDGCKLILSARREDRLEDVRKKCIEYGTIKSEDILVLPMDMLDYKSHNVAVETVLKYFKKIDILVNNAGRSQRALWEKTSLEVDKQMLDTNVLGPLSITKAVLPHFISQKAGHIVVTSSIAGKFGLPGLGSYSGSKHAIQGWFDSLRIEGYQYNIKVTMVCPGPVFSEALQHAFTEKEGQTLGVDMKPGENRMSAERCATLMAVAMANSMDEVWITRNPELFYSYLFQYFPAIARSVAKPLGQRRLKKIKAGIKDLHSK